VPNTPADGAALSLALKAKLRGMEARFPGLGVEEKVALLHVVIPAQYRVGHEAHFAQVTGLFLGYLKDPKTLPAWEQANMRAKYEVTTRGVELSQRSR
jgi:hypothetical protein